MSATYERLTKIDTHPPTLSPTSFFVHLTIPASQCRRSLVCPQPVTHLFHVILTQEPTSRTHLADSWVDPLSQVSAALPLFCFFQCVPRIGPAPAHSGCRSPALNFFIKSVFLWCGVSLATLQEVWMQPPCNLFWSDFSGTWRCFGDMWSDTGRGPAGDTATPRQRNYSAAAATFFSPLL